MNTRRRPLPRARAPAERGRIVAVVAAVLAGAVFLFAWAQAGRWREARDRDARRAEITGSLAAHRAALASAVANRLALVEGLRAFVEVKVARGERPDDQYAEFAGRLFTVVRGVRNLAVARGSVYTLVYPSRGNERVIGYDLLADDRPDVVEDTRRAMKGDGIALGGPYELRQGGIGLVGREAVFSAGRYWGLVAVAVDLQPILDDAGLSAIESGVEMAVRKPGRPAFFGSPAIFSRDPVIAKVELPDGHWDIAAIPKAGWLVPGAASRRLWLLTGALLALVPTSLVLLVAWRQQVLTEAMRDAERRVEEGTRRLRLASLVVENSPVVLVRRRSTEGRPVEYVSENVRQFGYTPDDFLSRGLVYDRLVLADDLPRVERQTANALASGSRRFQQEYRIVTKDGRVRWMEDRTAIVNDPDGGVSLEGILVDITERKLVEEVRQEVERRLREMLENVQLIAIMLDREGRITFCNSCLLRLGGWERDEVIGRNWFELFVPEPVRARALADFDAVVKGGGAWHSENPLVTRAGQLREIAWDNTVLRDLSGTVIGAASFGRDVTEQRQLEMQYRQSQKMEAIGQLAGGVAHDFNNLLQVITGYASLALADPATGPSLQPELTEIRNAAERATSLVQQLLTFGRQQKIARRPVDLNETVANLLKMLRRLIGEHIEVEFRPGEGLAAAFADPGLLEQVLMNLCVNARDAMPDGGRLTISTSDATLGREFVQRRGWGTAGRYVRVRVADTGRGIPPGLEDRIFEPFFTTKEVGKGTGLGLATVYGIVKQHEGFVELVREVARGAAFDVYIPVAQDAAAAAPKVRPAGPAPAGTGTILLAEDEDLVRRLAQRVLDGAGYRVIVARDGAEALDLVESRAGEIDLALLDVAMPKAGGAEVAARLKAIRPEVPILFCSGYSRQMVDEGWMIDQHESELLLKPYEPAALLERVHARLSRKLDEPS